MLLFLFCQLLFPKSRMIRFDSNELKLSLSAGSGGFVPGISPSQQREQSWWRCGWVGMRLMPESIRPFPSLSLLSVRHSWMVWAGLRLTPGIGKSYFPIHDLRTCCGLWLLSGAVLISPLQSACWATTKCWNLSIYCFSMTRGDWILKEGETKNQREWKHEKLGSAHLCCYWMYCN